MSVSGGLSAASSDGSHGENVVMEGGIVGPCGRLYDIEDIDVTNLGKKQWLEGIIFHTVICKYI
jgi:hypothetical protein